MYLFRATIASVGTLVFWSLFAAVSAADKPLKHPGKAQGYGQGNGSAQEAGYVNSQTSQRTEDKVTGNRSVPDGNAFSQYGSVLPEPTPGRPLDRTGNTEVNSFIGCPCDGNGI
jgi:hypothetical protein